MPRKSGLIPQAPVKRIMLDSGANRVSSDAVSTMTDILIELGMEIGEQSVRIAKHAGRKTVTASDVKMASKD
ncbi:MAG: histone family protein [Nanoarchaeota archaeon]